MDSCRSRSSIAAHARARDAPRITAAADASEFETAIDPPGYLLSGVGVGALIFAIIDGAEAGWTSAAALAGLIAAVVALGGFVAWELHTARPMLDVRLFKLPGFSTGTVGLTVQFLCLFGFFLVGLQFLLLVLGFSPLHSAVCVLPLGMVVMPLSRVAPRIIDRFGQRAVMSSGLACLAAGLAIMSQLDGDSSYWHFLAGLIVCGLGMAFTSTPATTAIVGSLPMAKQGIGSAVNDVSRELGSALGIAILGSLFSAGYSHSVDRATSALPLEAAHAVSESAGAGFAVASHLGPRGEELSGAVRHAFAVGLSGAMTAGAVIAGLAAVFTVWRAPRRAVATSGLRFSMVAIDSHGRDSGSATSVSAPKQARWARVRNCAVDLRAQGR